MNQLTLGAAAILTAAALAALLYAAHVIVGAATTVLQIFERAL